MPVLGRHSAFSAWPWRPALDRLRRAVDQVLGFLQAQAGQFADDLDDGDLLRRVGNLRQHHVHRGLRRRSRRATAAAASRSSHHHRAASRRFDTVNFLQVVAELLGLEQ